MTRKQLRTITILALLACLTSQVAAQDPDLAITSVNVIPMNETGLLEDRTVLISGDKILQVMPADEAKIPDACRRIDGRGRYLIPGLVDAHTHTTVTSDLTLYLTHGVTSILEMSGNPDILTLREELRAGERLGPRLFTTGPQFKVRANPIIDREIGASDPEQLPALVRSLAAQGYDFLKIWGPVSQEVHAAICKTASEVGIPVTGHIPRDIGLQQTLENGQSSFAHVEEYWNKYFRKRPDEKRMPTAVDASKAAEVSVVTTLMTYENIAYTLAESDERKLSRPDLRWIDASRRMLWSTGMNEYLRKFERSNGPRKLEELAFKQRIAGALHAGGVPLVAGTDCGGTNLSMLPGESLHRELELLVESGLSPWEALRTATFNAGQFMDQGRSGAITAGQQADLVLLAENPIENISHTRTVQGVVSGGRWFAREDLDELLAELATKMSANNALIDAILSEGAERAFASYDSRDEGALAYEPSAIGLAAFLLILSERMEDAVAVLIRISEDHPEQYQPYFLLAGLSAGAGDRETALEALQVVLELVPGHPQAQALLRELGG
ncbi:MAG: amidohydrolase family protein [Planctomycetota bacterium]